MTIKSKFQVCLMLVLVFALWAVVITTGQQGTTIIRDSNTNVRANVKAAGTATPNVLGVQGNINGVPLPTTIDVSTLNTLLARLDRDLSKPLYLSDAFGNRIGSDGNRLRVSVPVGDPCSSTVEKRDAPISQTANTIIIAGIPGLRTAVCAMRVVVGATAEITSEAEGTGTACATSTVIHSGSATLANGEAFAANDGYQAGTGGSVVFLALPGNDVCIFQSGSNRVSGKMTYIRIPPQ